MTTSTFVYPRVMVWLVAGCALVAGIVHLWITPEHYEHAPIHGVFFAVAGIMEIAWAFLLWRRPSDRMLGNGAILAAGLVVLWGLTQLFPIPYDHHHTADIYAYVTKIAEGAAFVLAGWLLWRHGAHRPLAMVALEGLVLPMVLGIALYEAAFIQGQEAWFTPTTGVDGTASQELEEYDHGTATEHDMEHNQEDMENVATVAVVEVVPTNTPPSSPTVAQTQIEVVSTPTAIPFTLESAATTTYRLSGDTEAITQDLELKAELVLFEFDHPADTPFAFFLLDKESNHLTMPANHLHGAAGQGVYRVKADGIYRLHVIAEDAWTASVIPLDSVRLLDEATTWAPMEGYQSVVSPPIRFKAGSYTWTWHHEGELGFEVVLVRVDAPERIAAITTMGVGNGTTTFEVPNEGVYLVYVFADGVWTLE